MHRMSCGTGSCERSLKPTTNKRIHPSRFRESETCLSLTQPKMNTVEMPSALTATHFHLPGQTHYYKGKVRDVYTIQDQWLVMVVTDRISAFDVVLPKAIPFKGQVLNQLASRMMKATEDIVPNWILSVPDPNVTLGKKCEPF